MANPYCDLTKLGWFIDTRSTGMLTNDSNSNNADATVAQGLMDVAASELTSHLSGRVPLPLTSVPLVLTRWVATKAAESFFSRRGDLPKAVKAAVDWANQWIKDFDEGEVSLDGVQRSGSDALENDHYQNCRTDAAKRQLTEGL